MKKHALYTALAGITFAFAITSCQCEEEPIVQPKTTTDLKLSTDTVSLSVGDSTNLDILSGDGDYKAFSENPDIVAVELIKDKFQLGLKKKEKQLWLYPMQQDVLSAYLFFRVTVAYC